MPSTLLWHIALALPAADEVEVDTPPLQLSVSTDQSSDRMPQEKLSYKATDSRELAMEISVTSLGSNHTLRRPQSSTDAANRFCSFKLTMTASRNLSSLPRLPKKPPGAYACPRIYYITHPY